MVFFFQNRNWLQNKTLERMARKAFSVATGLWGLSSKYLDRQRVYQFRLWLGKLFSYWKLSGIFNSEGSVYVSSDGVMFVSNIRVSLHSLISYFLRAIIIISYLCPY